MANTLTWLHVSDLHMRADRRSDLLSLLQTFWLDLDDQLRHLQVKNLDFIAFSGDVAYSGKASEYTDAKEHFFNKLKKLTKTNSFQDIYIVPGNHDVDRDARALLQSPFLKGNVSNDKAHQIQGSLLSDPSCCETFLGPMTNYGKFIGEIRSPKQIAPPYAFADTLSFEHAKVVICGLNSAWHSGFNKKQGKVVDKNYLLVGLRQVQDVLQRITESDLVICLIHHPLAEMFTWDEAAVRRELLNNKCFVLLHGHVHTPDIESSERPAGKLVTIPAGSVHGDTLNSLHGYTVAQLDLESGELKAVFRRYSTQHGRWGPDSATTDTTDGVRLATVPIQIRATRDSKEVPMPNPLPWGTGIDWRPPLALPSSAQEGLAKLHGFVESTRETTVVIWGPPGSQGVSFSQAVQTLLNEMDVDVIRFECNSLDSGRTIDEQYFIRGLQRWLGSNDRMAIPVTGSIREQLRSLQTLLDRRLMETGRRLAFLFVNFQMTPSAVAQWVHGDLLKNTMEPLGKYRHVAVLLWEGPKLDAASAELKRISLESHLMPNSTNRLGLNYP